MPPRFHLVSVKAPASPRLDDASILISDFQLNHHERFRAEIIMRDGTPVVTISRWKSTSKGLKRTGQCFEFGAHRTGAVVALLFEVQDALIALSAQGGAS